MRWIIPIFFLAGLAAFGGLFWRGKLTEIFGNPATGELAGKLGREFEVVQRKSGYIFTPQTWSGTVEIADDVTAFPWAPVTIEPGTRIVVKKEKQGEQGEQGDARSVTEEFREDAAARATSEPAQPPPPQVTITGRLIPKGTKDQPICIYVEP